MNLTVSAQQADGRTIVTAVGELDAHSAPSLQSVLGDYWGESGIALIIDLGGVTFIDSTGLGVLVTTLKHVREVEGTLDLVVVTPRVLKVFEITGLDVVIPLHDSLTSITS